MDLNLDIALVDKHCRRFESARAAASSTAVDMATNIEAMIAVEGVGEVLRDARSAMRFTGYYDIAGNPIFEKDWTTVLDSVDTLGTLISKSRSKEGGNVNIAIQNNSTNGNGNGSGTVRSFEQRVREHRAALSGSNDTSRMLPSADAEIVDDGDTADGTVVDADELVETGTAEAIRARQDDGDNNYGDDGSMNDAEAGDEDEDDSVDDNADTDADANVEDDQ